MPVDTKAELQTALAKLKTNLKNNFYKTLISSGFVDATLQEFETLANETIEIIEADLEAQDEKTKTLFSLHREAMLSHYLDVVNTLNAAITETDPYQMASHQKKIEELANVSKPRLKTVLYGLASSCAMLAAALLSAEMTWLVAGVVGFIATPFIGFALGLVLRAIAIPIGDKTKAEGYRLYAESSKHFQHAGAVHDLNQKRKKFPKIDESTIDGIELKELKKLKQIR